MSRTLPARLAAVTAAVLLVSVMAGCSAGSTTGTSDPATGQPAASQQPSGQTQPGQESLHTSKQKVQGDEKAVIKTSKGDIVVRLYPKEAPNTVATFVELANSKFYDGTTFHRVEPGFVIQGGDPQTKDANADPNLYGTGGPGFKLKAEFNDRKHVAGTVAMARSQDPDSAGSQFYITLAPQPMLDGQYTVFGQVVSGMDVVKKVVKGDKITAITIEHGN